MSLTDVIATLQQQLPHIGLIMGADIGGKYHVDFSGENECPPGAVVRPRSTADVAGILATCHAAQQPLVIQGGMTGLTGGATPQPGELALSLEQMTGIEIDRAGCTATVEAGTPLQALQEAAAAAGLMFPLDLGARGSCNVGGNIATNAGGNQVLRFGMMRNLVLGLEVVLADGTVVSSMNQMLKNNAGYDLKQLFIGSEGTLGVVTRAVLRLFPAQPARTTAICAVTDFDAMVQLLHHLQRDLGGSLSAFEAMWQSYFDFCVSHVEQARHPFEHAYPIYVLIETEGRDTARETQRLEQTLADALDGGCLVDAVLARSERERSDFWRIRDGIGDITPILQPMLAFDVSMPVAVMPAFIDAVDTRLREGFAAVRTFLFGHIGDNNLHIAVAAADRAHLAGISDTVYRTTGEFAGSISAEHGIGMLRRDYLHLSRNPAEIALMTRLKQALDPNGILNRARVIPRPDPAH